MQSARFIPAGISKALLLLAIVFSMATQLRWIDGYVGPSEVFGLLLIACSIINRNWTLPPVALVGLLLVPAGMVVGGMLNAVFTISTTLTGRDLLAVIYAGALGVSAIGVLRDVERPGSTFANALSAAVVFQLIPLVLLFFNYPTNAWMGDEDEPGLPFLTRYTGFSENPNQLGILICAAPLAIGLAICEAAGWLQRCWLAVGLIATGLIALLIDSNTVFLSYLVALGLGVTLWVMGWPKRKPGAGRDLLRALSGFVGIPAFLAAIGLYLFYSIGKTGNLDADGRFQRWQFALEGINKSIFLGVGPGAQSGITGPFQGTEAHNVLLDSALQGGLISLIGYVVLVWAVCRAAWLQRSRWLICLLAAVLTEQMAHYTLRQPIGWMYVLLPFTLVGASKAVPASHMMEAKQVTP